MKIYGTGVSVGDKEMAVARVEEFRQTEFAKRALGKLFLALIDDESIWSQDFYIYGHFEEDKKNDEVRIYREHFPDHDSNQSITITPNSEHISVEHVAKVILLEYQSQIFGIQMSLRVLENTAMRIFGNGRKIINELAVKYLSKRFPDNEIKYICSSSRGIVCLNINTSTCLIIETEELMNKDRDIPIYPVPENNSKYNFFLTLFNQHREDFPDVVHDRIDDIITSIIKAKEKVTH